MEKTEKEATGMGGRPQVAETRRGGRVEEKMDEMEMEGTGLRDSLDGAGARW